jgi:hypothetical protein
VPCLWNRDALDEGARIHHAEIIDPAYELVNVPKLGRKADHGAYGYDAQIEVDGGGGPPVGFEQALESVLDAEASLAVTHEVLDSGSELGQKVEQGGRIRAAIDEAVDVDAD